MRLMSILMEKQEKPEADIYIHGETRKPEADVYIHGKKKTRLMSILMEKQENQMLMSSVHLIGLVVLTNQKPAFSGVPRSRPITGRVLGNSHL